MRSTPSSLQGPGGIWVGLIGSGGCFRLTSWQAWQPLTTLAMSPSMPGHHTHSRRRIFIFAMPKCPSCANARTCAYWLDGITKREPRSTNWPNTERSCLTLQYAVGRSDHSFWMIHCLTVASSTSFSEACSGCQGWQYSSDHNWPHKFLGRNMITDILTYQWLLAQIVRDIWPSVIMPDWVILWL